MVVAAALLTAPASASAATGPVTARCVRPAARVASAKPRDCTIQGTVTGHHVGPDGVAGPPISWHGELVLKQMLIDPFTGTPPSQPTFAVSTGTSIEWKLDGSSGGCSLSGSGTLGAADLTGDLTVTGPHGGRWRYSLDVGPRTPRSSSDVVMPYTVACPDRTYRSEASETEGLLFGYNGVPPLSNQTTEGEAFAGEINAGVSGVWSWSLRGEVFPQEVSERGIAFIKAREGLRLHAYEDQLHLCTIGYGHLILPQGRCRRRASMHWTRQEAETQLRADLDKLIEPYLRKASTRLGMNQCEYDALASFAYNVAHGKGGESPSWRRLMAGATPANWHLLVQERLPTFVYGLDAVTGKRVKLADLIKRRTRELHVFTAQVCPCDGVPS